MKPKDLKMDYVQAKSEHPVLFKEESKYDVWNLTLTYKNNSVSYQYATLKGEFKEPNLDMVMNSLFTNAQIYDRFKDDPFGFMHRFGAAIKSAHKVNELLENMKDVYTILVTLFGNDYKKYEKYYVNLRPVTPIIK